jgi:hypothetical protein
MSVVVLAACSGGGADACTGLVEPSRVIRAIPGTLALDVGLQAQVTASVSSGCPADDKSVAWISSAPGIASVDASGAVLAVGPGTAVLTASAFGDQARSSVAVIVRPRVAVTLDVSPATDTLLIDTTRRYSARVRDQRGDPLITAPVVWRSLAPSLATVTPNGDVTAVATGIARIEAAIKRYSIWAKVYDNEKFAKRARSSSVSLSLPTRTSVCRYGRKAAIRVSPALLSLRSADSATICISGCVAIRRTSSAPV